MTQNPIYFDGSSQPNLEVESNEILQMTEEMRKNIGMNPYSSVEGK